MRDVVKEAWDNLRESIDRACIARGEAQWTNGYRCGMNHSVDQLKAEQLYQKERRQFQVCEKAEAWAELQVAAYRRVVLADATHKRQRALRIKAGDKRGTRQRG